MMPSEIEVLYDITTLGSIHCAPGVEGAGIFRATKLLGQALHESDNVRLSLCSAASQWHKAVRYLNETQDFDPALFLLPSHGSNPAQPMTGLCDGRSANDPKRTTVTEYLNQAYSPERIYNPGSFDVYHLNWRAAERIPAHARPAIVTSVFDVIALKRPDWFVASGEPNPIGDYLAGLISSAKPQHHITVNTESVKSDVLELFPDLSSNQVHVVPLGVSERFERSDDQDAIARVRERYGVPAASRYLLCVNTLEPRKNMAAAIEAFAELVADGVDDDVCLVLAGSKGWLYEDVIAKTSRYGPEAQSRIIFTGYVADVDMPTLYSGATAFCYPSLDEGFGLPVLEAMRAGLPVISSNRAPLVEVAGNAALLVEPTDTTSLAGAMHTLLKDDDLRTRLSDEGVVRAESYTWERSAAEMHDVYERASADAIGRRKRFRRKDSAPHRSEVANSSLESMRDRFRGHRVFVLGAGSTDVVPHDLFANELTIVTNGWGTTTTRGWKPDWYVVADPEIESAAGELINGLTGSLFLFDEGSDVLRSGSDVRSVASLLESESSSQLPDLDRHGPFRSLQVALYLAAHLGFDSIYLVDPEAAGGWTLGGPKHGTAHNEERRRSWHRNYRSAQETKGRSIVNTSPAQLTGVYATSHLANAITHSSVPDFNRADQVSLDETQVVAKLFARQPKKVRTMLDIGAHRGTSAVHFVKDDWKVHCFEPDPDNRSHLQRKFGDYPNLSIDDRAVGREPATKVPFFTSPQSSGISGLSDFHRTHEQTGLVDMTTVAEIVTDRGLRHIDFLKIDVEGFDFDVLRGVPWDTVRPDVIECEFEDAKTVPLGHTTSDIADFLIGMGYSVYLSEWHPIIEYGVAHDWRRLVPYPGLEVPGDSWGNILAFKADPGMDELLDIFRSVTTSRKVQEVDVGRGSSSTSFEKRRIPPVSASSDHEEQPAQVGSSSYLLRRLRDGLVAMWKLATPLALVLVTLCVLTVILPQRLATLSASAAVLGIALAGLAVVGRLVLKNAAAIRLVGTRLDRHEARITREASRLSNRVTSLQDDRDLMRNALDEFFGRLEAIPTDITTRVSRLEHGASQQEKLVRAISDSERGVSDRVSEMLETQTGLAELATLLQAELAEAKSTTSGNEIRLSALEAVGLEALTERIQGHDVRLSGLAEEADAFRTNGQEALADLRSELLVLVEHIRTQSEFSNYSNAWALRTQTRRLGGEDVARIREHWLRHLGLDLTDREIWNLAHSICMDEEVCEGRLATTVQAAILRALVSLSIDSPTVEFLEIGTLFGVAAGSLHRTLDRAGKDMRLTLVDPLDGYYGTSPVDRQTGVRITADTLRTNLHRLNVDKDSYRLIQHKSTLPEAVDLVSDRQYDLLLIDGDHSLKGVANDFERFAPLVKPGGFVIFDDYDTVDWPSIKPYVDEHARPLDDWLWIGGEWRTGILRRKVT